MITDSHVHIFAPEVIENRDRFLSDKGFALLYSSPAAKMKDAEGLLAAMTESSISRAFVMGFPWQTEFLCRKQNLYFAEVSSRCPELECFGSVPAGDSRLIKKTVMEIKGNGLSGIGELGFYGGMNQETEKYLHAVLEYAEDMSLPVCIHINEPVGHIYPGKYEPDLSLMYRVISAHPDVIIQLAHWGGGFPFYELMPEVKQAFKNVFYDSAAGPFLYSENIWNTAVSLAGADKILFGTDYPLIPFRRYLDQTDRTVTDFSVKEQILEKNSEKIIPLKQNQNL